MEQKISPQRKVFQSIFFFLLFLFALFTTWILPFIAFAQDDAPKDFGLSNTAKGVFGGGIGELADHPALLVGIILKSLLSFIGVIFFVFIVHGGLKWMTAKGDKDQVKRAQNIIVHSTIALVIILSAYAIATYVTKTLVGMSQQ